MIPEITKAPAVHDAPDGVARIWSARPGLVVSQVEGRMLLDHATPIMAAVDAAIAGQRGRVTVVHDWTAVESYEVAVHARMSAWTVTVMSAMERVVIGVTSPFVTLAVRTVNLATGNRFELLDDRVKVLEVVRAEMARL